MWLLRDSEANCSIKPHFRCWMWATCTYAEVGDKGENAWRFQARKTRINPQMKSNILWLEVSKTKSSKAMLCFLCKKKNSSRPKRCISGKAVWVNIPCWTSVCRSLTEHKRSLYHKEEICTETMYALTDKGGGVTRVFDEVVSVQKKAFIGHLKCMYSLNKQEFAHYQALALAELGLSLGATYLPFLLKLCPSYSPFWNPRENTDEQIFTAFINGCS